MLSCFIQRSSLTLHITTTQKFAMMLGKADIRSMFCVQRVLVYCFTLGLAPSSQRSDRSCQAMFTPHLWRPFPNYDSLYNKSLISVFSLQAWMCGNWLVSVLIQSQLFVLQPLSSLIFVSLGGKWGEGRLA